MKKLIATFLLTLALPALAALEAAGVKFDDKMKVGAGDTVINGVGVRGVLFIKGYAMALYLPQKTAAAGEAISAKGAKRVRIVLLRDTSGETFADAPACERATKKAVVYRPHAGSDGDRVEHHHRFRPACAHGSPLSLYLAHQSGSGAFDGHPAACPLRQTPRPCPACGLTPRPDGAACRQTSFPAGSAS